MLTHTHTHTHTLTSICTQAHALLQYDKADWVNFEGSTHGLDTLGMQRSLFCFLSSKFGSSMFPPHPTTFTVEFKSRSQTRSTTLCSSSGHASVLLDPLLPFLLPSLFIHHLTQHICEWTPTTMAGRQALKHWIKVCALYAYDIVLVLDCIEIWHRHSCPLQDESQQLWWSLNFTSSATNRSKKTVCPVFWFMTKYLMTPGSAVLINKFSMLTHWTKTVNMENIKRAKHRHASAVILSMLAWWC